MIKKLFVLLLFLLVSSVSVFSAFPVLINTPQPLSYTGDVNYFLWNESNESRFLALESFAAIATANISSLGSASLAEATQNITTLNGTVIGLNQSVSELVSFMSLITFNYSSLNNYFTSYISTATLNISDNKAELDAYMSIATANISSLASGSTSADVTQNITELKNFAALATQNITELKTYTIIATANISSNKAELDAYMALATENISSFSEVTNADVTANITQLRENLSTVNTTLVSLIISVIETNTSVNTLNATVISFMADATANISSLSSGITSADVTLNITTLNNTKLQNGSSGNLSNLSVTHIYVLNSSRFGDDNASWSIGTIDIRSGRYPVLQAKSGNSDEVGVIKQGLYLVGNSSDIPTLAFLNSSLDSVTIMFSTINESNPYFYLIHAFWNESKKDVEFTDINKLNFVVGGNTTSNYIKGNHGYCLGGNCIYNWSDINQTESFVTANITALNGSVTWLEIFAAEVTANISGLSQVTNPDVSKNITTLNNSLNWNKTGLQVHLREQENVVNISSNLTVEGVTTLRMNTSIGNDLRYIKVGEFDLTQYEYGKYPIIEGYSDSALGNLFAFKDALAVVGYQGMPAIMLAIEDLTTQANIELNNNYGKSTINMNAPLVIDLQGGGGSNPFIAIGDEETETTSSGKIEYDMAGETFIFNRSLNVTAGDICIKDGNCLNSVSGETASDVTANITTLRENASSLNTSIMSLEEFAKIATLNITRLNLSASNKQNEIGSACVGTDYVQGVNDDGTLICDTPTVGASATAPDVTRNITTLNYTKIENGSDAVLNNLLVSGDLMIGTQEKLFFENHTINGVLVLNSQVNADSYIEVMPDTINFAIGSLSATTVNAQGGLPLNLVAGHINQLTVAVIDEPFNRSSFMALSAELNTDEGTNITDGISLRAYLNPLGDFELLRALVITRDMGELTTGKSITGLYIDDFSPGAFDNVENGYSIITEGGDVVIRNGNINLTNGYDICIESGNCLSSAITSTPADATFNITENKNSLSITTVNITTLNNTKLQNGSDALLSKVNVSGAFFMNNSNYGMGANSSDFCFWGYASGGENRICLNFA